MWRSSWSWRSQRRNFLANAGVEGTEGFVQEEHGGFDGEGPGEGDALALPARKLRGESGSPVPSSWTRPSSSSHLGGVSSLSGGRVARGRTRRPKATFSKTLMCRNSA